MATIMTTYLTSFYELYPAVWDRLRLGETIDSDDMSLDWEVRSAISEGGGCIWFCERCRVVHSPNRPGGCMFEDDDTGCLGPTVPSEAQLKAMRDADLAYEEDRQERQAKHLERLEARLSHHRVR